MVVLLNLISTVSHFVLSKTGPKYERGVKKVKSTFLDSKNVLLTF